MPLPLKTERLLLRAPTPDDLDAWHAIYLDAEEVWYGAPRSSLDENRAIPAWIDEVLKKAVHLDPYKRYEEVSELTYALRYPNQDLIPSPRPLLERNPLLFWQCSTLMLVAVVLLLLFSKHG